jgi:hypothetical protein
MRRRLLAALAICAASALLGATVPTSGAFADSSLTPDEQAFQAGLTNYVLNLQSALVAAAQNPATAADIGPQMSNQMTALSTAQQEIPQLTGPQLDAMEGILGQNQSWQQQPLVMQQALSGMAISGPAVQLPGYLSDCTSNPGDARTLFYASWAAAQVAAAANAVASGLPDGADFAPALIIAAVIFGTANGIAIGLQSDLSLSTDCLTAAANQALENTWPEDSSNNFIPESSQYSVDQLKLQADSIQTTLDNIQTDINSITLQLVTVINNVGTAQGTANDVNTRATDIQSRTDALLNAVGTPSDTAIDPCAPSWTPTCGTPSGTSNGLANTVNNREDTTLANTAAFQTLSLRAEIEAALAAPSSGVEAMFALPSSQGGYLQTVQSIVTQTINNMIAANQPVGTAQSKLAAGNTALGLNQYDTAYLDYQQAYDLASQ